VSTTIASASVRIGPDLSDFRAELEAEVRSAIAGATAKVRVDADTAEADAKVAATDLELDRINGRTVTATVKVNSSDTQKAEQGISTLVTAVLGLGPALVPIGAALVGVGVGGAAAFGSVALGAGTAVLAVQGISKTLKDFSAEAAAPSAANLQKLSAQMNSLAPAAQSTVRFLESDLIPQFDKLRNVAAQGLFPGVDAGIRSLEGGLPAATGLIASLSSEMGRLAAEAGKSLGGPAFRGFFTYIDSAAAPTLDTFAHAVGNIAVGFAGLAHGFAPVTAELGQGLDSLTSRFAKFGETASSNAGFQHFISYLETAGPEVGRTLEALAASFSHILVAIAPLGGGTLALVRAFAEITASIPTAELTPLVAIISTGAIAMKTYTLYTKGAALAQKVFTTSTEEGIAAVNPYVAALLAAVAVYGLVASASAKQNAAIAAGRQEVDDYVASLNANYASAVSVGKVTDDLTGKFVAATTNLKAFAAAQGGGLNGLIKAGSALQEYGRQVQVAQAKQTAITANTKALAAQYGLTTTQVTRLASAHKDDLSGSLSTVSARFGAEYTAAQKTHQPITQAAADVKILGDSTATAAEQLTALTDELAIYAGNALSTQQASLAFKDDIAALVTALKASHGSLDVNTKSGRAAAEAYNTAAQQAISYATSVEKSTGSTQKARAVLVAARDTLEKFGGTSKVTKSDINDLNAAISGIPKTADSAASGMQSGGKEISAAAADAAKAAERALSSGVGQAHTAGENFTAGFAAGIGDSLSGVIASAAAAVGAAVHTVERTQKSHSPSEVTRSLGVDFGTGFALGVTDTQNTIAAAVQQTVKAAATSLGKELTHELTQVGNEQSKAQARLSNLRSSASSVRSSTVAGFQSLGDPSQFASQTSVGQVLSILGKQTKVGSAFEANLAKDRAKGLDKTAYNELLAGGPAQNSNIAALLAQATKAQIAAFNRDEAKLNREGHQTGSTSARYLFGKQIDAATKVVQRIDADQHELLAVQRELNKDLKELAKHPNAVTRSEIEGMRQDIRAIGRDVANALNGVAHHAHTRQRSRPVGARG
jgi:hypothetical protein